MADLVTGNSEAVIEAALRRGIAADRLRLVPNGHAAMPALQPPEDPPVLLGCVARFRPEKGHLRLLDALDLIDTDIPWRVDLAGDGPLLATSSARSRPAV
jgi:glycosyltransferase involved in cell wall biosynthesis